MKPEIPPPYLEESVGDVDLIALPGALAAARAALEEHGSLHRWAETRPGARELLGRGSAWAVPAPDGDGRWLVRHYRRGGFVARFVQDRYLDMGVHRPLRELIASVKARARDVPTPEVVAATIHRVGVWYRSDIVTRFVGGTRDLDACLFDEGDAVRRVRAMGAAGRLVRRAHEAGVVHNDLNLKNILIAGDGAEVDAWLIDLDRAVVMRDAAARFERNLMLRRFGRSLRKQERRHGQRLRNGEREAFAEGYAQGGTA